MFSYRPKKPNWLGIIFPGVHIVFLFKTDYFSVTLKSSDKGEVFWINRKDLKQYSFADDFDKILEIFENDNLSEEYFWFDGEWHEKIYNNREVK